MFKVLNRGYRVGGAVLLPFVAVSMVGCANGQDGVGEAVLELVSAPTNVSCIQITVAGNRTVQRLFPVVSGQSTVLTASTLPAGLDTFSGAAYPVACSAVTANSTPTWIASPVVAQVLASQTVNVALPMRSFTPGTGTGQARVSVDFPGLTEVAAALDGQMWLAPCRQDTQAGVCATNTGACPVSNPSDPALSGVHMTDKTFTLGGNPGQPYTITLHLQGEVESKQYTGSTDAESILTSPMSNGWAVNGTPVQSNAYNIYLLRVTNPGSTTRQDYFLNSLQPPGVSNHTTYGVDYTTTFSAQGGATVRLVVADPNCSQIKNCGPTVNDGSFCAAPIVLANIEPSAVSKNPTFNFSSPFNGQWIVATVKNVTSP